MCLVKFFVFAVNFIFALAGVGLIVAGALTNYKDYDDAIPEDFQKLTLAPILTITIGSIIFVIAFFGFCGACTSSPRLLNIYAGLLLVIFILQIVLGILTFVKINQSGDLKAEISSSMKKIFDKYDKDKELVDLIQAEFKCCGTDGPAYWPVDKVPDSCCKYAEKSVKNCVTYYTHGCSTSFFEALRDSMHILAIVVLSASVFEVVTCILSICLANQIKNENRRANYR